MSDLDCPWPEPGHKFFEFARTRPDAYSWMRRSLGEYAYMYRESAERLMNEACEAPGLLNVYAIPAVYLYRHSVELSLKDMLVEAGWLNDLPGDFPDGHGLQALWTRLRGLLSEGGVTESDDEFADMEVVDEMIRELDATDPASMAFRYPVGKQSKGRQALLSDAVEYFDMRVFREQAARLSGFLDGCGSKLSVYLDIKRDMDSTYRSEDAGCRRR